MRKIFTLIGLAVLLATSLQLQAQDSFTALNGIPGAEVREIHKDTNGKLYTVVRSNGRVYTSTDNGNTWDYLDVGVNDIYAFYIDGADLYFFTYDQMYKSTDGGSTWNRVNSQFNRFLNVFKVHKSPVSATTWIIEGPCEGVFISTDDGVNWTNIVSETCNSGSDGDYQLTLNSNGDIYFVNERQGLLRHKNPADGIWDESKLELVFTKERPDDDYNLSVIATISNRIVIAYSNAAREFKLASSTSGDNGTYTDITLPASNLYYDRSTLNLGFDGKLNLVGHENFMFELTDEVTPTWTEKTHPENEYGYAHEVFVYWFSASELYACSSHHGILRSQDGGSSWQMANGSGSKALLFGSTADVEVLPNGNIVVLPIGFPKGVYVSTDQGNNFSFHRFGGLDEATFTRSTGLGLFKLQDNSLLIHGNTLKRSVDGINWTTVAPVYAPLYLPVTGGDIYMVRDNSTAIDKTTLTDVTDGGSTITVTTIEAGLPNSSYIYSIIEHQGDFYLDLENYTTNQREFWKIETSIIPFTSQKLITPFTLDGGAGVVSVGGKIYISNGSNVAYSSNQGVTWTTFNYSRHDQLIAIDQEGGGIGLASQGGFAVTQDDGQTWSTIGMPEVRATIQSITKDAGNNFIAATSYGPVAKFEGKLVLNASELPPPINVSWQPLNGPFGGGIESLVKDSQGNLYGSKNGGLLFKLPVGSDTWQRVRTGLGESRVVYVDDNDALYSADYLNIAKSTDGGATWANVSGDGPNTQDIGNLLVADNGNIIVTSYGNGEGIYVSTDNGASFTTPLGSGSKGNFYHLIKSGSGTLWTLQDNGQSTIYTSTDNGLTWNVLNTIDLSNTSVLSINRLEGNAVAVVTEDDIGKTIDDGATWTSIKGSIPSTKDYDRNPGLSKVYLAPDNSYYFYNLLDVYISLDQGGSWSKSQNLSNEGSTILGQFIWRNSDIIAGSITTNGIRRSVNGTSTWSDFADGLANFYTYQGSITALGSKLYTDSGNGGDYFESSDDGQTFISDGPDYYDRFYKDPLGKLIRYGSGISFSINNGQTWSNNAGNGFFQQLVSPDGINYFAFYNDSNDNEQRKYGRSTDLVNWTEIPAPGYPFDNHGPSYMVAFGTDILFSLGWNDAAARHELYKFSFGSVERVTDPEVLGADNMHYHDGKIVIYNGYNGTLTTTEDGINWTQKAAPIVNFEIAAPMLHISENGFYFIPDKGTATMWLSKDEGSSWQSIDGFSFEVVFDVEVNLNNGYAYAAVLGDVMYKSNNIILQDDGVNPALAANNAFTPNDGALALAQFLPGLTIQYDEVVTPVSGKKIRLFEVDNPTTPVKTYDASEAKISIDGKTVSFDYNTTLDYSTQYFVIMEAGAFTDIFGNPAPAITANTGTGDYEWDFTVQDAPDNTPPSISLITALENLDFIKPTTKEFAINATDAIEVDALGAKIYYRMISDPASTAFKTAAMDASGNSDAPNLDFTIDAQEFWFDAIGLEFYFEVADKAGNTARFPATDDTYLYSYVDYSVQKPQIEDFRSGATESVYRIIAVPFDLDQANAISGQFSEYGVADDPNIKEKFRIGTWNNAREEYDEYPETLTTIGRGKGYWIIFKEATDIVLSNAVAAKNNRDNFFTMSLAEGWNQIGNPYPVPISWDEVKAQNGNVGELKVYRNGTFSNISDVNGGVLQPYEGGFVRSSVNIGNVVIRFQGISSGGRTAGKSYDLAAEEWNLPLALRQGEFTNAIGGIGMAPEALEGEDSFDDFNPPTITHRLELLFDNSDAAPLAKSVVKTKDSQAWSFTAYTGGTDMVSLIWDNSKFGDNDIGLWLYDEERVAFVDMRANTEYKYLATPEKKFKIYYGELPELEVAPSFSLLGEPWPNPASGKLNIPFAINAEHGTSEVVINIFDAQGRLVKEITNQVFDPGTHQLEWLPNRSANQLGLHLIQWNMITEKGDRLQETKRVLVK